MEAGVVTEVAIFTAVVFTAAVFMAVFTVAAAASFTVVFLARGSDIMAMVRIPVVGLGLSHTIHTTGTTGTIRTTATSTMAIATHGLTPREQSRRRWHGAVITADELTV